MVNMKDNNIGVLNTNNGQLIHSERKVKSSLTKKYLTKCFEKFISDVEKREQMLNYIFDSREVKMVENIKRK